MVTGLGAVIRPPGQPDMRIQVRLTAFRENDAWERAERHPQGLLDPNRFWWDLVPIGLLPGLCVGQLWRDGEQLPTPDYEYEEFSGLEIRSDEGIGDPSVDSPSAVVWDDHYVAVGDPGVRPRMIPSEAFRVDLPAPFGYRWPGKHAGVLLLRIRLPGTTDRLLVPCTEIARCFFAHSTRLADALFSGYQASDHEPLDVSGGAARHLTELYNLAHSRVREDGQPWIRLRMRILNDDAETVAILRYDNFARKMALAVEGHLSLREQQRHVPVVEARLPFEGKSSLGVQGTWLESEVGGKRVRHFLAFCIKKYEREKPFPLVRCDRDNRHGEASEGGDGGEGIKVPGVPRPRPSSEEVVWPDRRPTILAGLVTTRVDRVEMIAGGKPVRVEHTRAADAEGVGSWGNAVGEMEQDGVNPDPGGWGAGETKLLGLVRKRGGFPSSESPEVPDVPRLHLGLEIFRDAVERVAEQEGWSLTWQTPDGPAREPTAVPFPADQEKKRPPWCYIDRGTPESAGERRRVLIAELGVGNSFVYLLDVERRPTERSPSVLLITPGRRLPREVFGKLIQHSVNRVTRKRGVWDSDWPPLRGHVHLLRHSKRPAAIATAVERGLYVERFARNLTVQVQGRSG